VITLTMRNILNFEKDIKCSMGRLQSGRTINTYNIERGHLTIPPRPHVPFKSGNTKFLLQVAIKAVFSGPQNVVQIGRCTVRCDHENGPQPTFLNAPCSTCGIGNESRGIFRGPFQPLFVGFSSAFFMFKDRERCRDWERQVGSYREQSNSEYNLKLWFILLRNKNRTTIHCWFYLCWKIPNLGW